jgi:hypothetical protein
MFHTAPPMARNTSVSSRCQGRDRPSHPDGLQSPLTFIGMCSARSVQRVTRRKVPREFPSRKEPNVVRLCRAPVLGKGEGRASGSAVENELRTLRAAFGELTLGKRSHCLDVKIVLVAAMNSCPFRPQLNETAARWNAKDQSHAARFQASRSLQQLQTPAIPPLGGPADNLL